MINGFHYVTLATDGSANTNRIGMAYYIRDDADTLRDAWYIDGTHKPIVSEWLALERALELLEKREYPTNTKLIYYGDNSTMIQVVEGGFSKKARGEWKRKHEWAQQILSKFASIEARHVPSHTARKDAARYALNRWCDYNARSMVRHGRLHQYRSRSIT